MGSMFLLWSGPHSRSVPRDPLKPKAVSESQRQLPFGTPRVILPWPPNSPVLSIISGNLPGALEPARPQARLCAQLQRSAGACGGMAPFVTCPRDVHCACGYDMYIRIYIYTAQWNVMEHRLLWDAIVTSRDCVQGWCQLSEPRHTEWVTCKSRTSRHYWP